MRPTNGTYNFPALRPLGASEKMFWLLHQAYPGHFALAARIDGNVSHEHLKHALYKVQKRHALLRARIALDETGYPWFVEDLSIIQLRFVQRLGERQWQTEVEHELSQPLRATEAPLFRAVLVHADFASELILTCHHSIADGLFASRLVREILQALSNPKMQFKSLPTPRPIEERLPKHVYHRYGGWSGIEQRDSAPVFRDSAADETSNSNAVRNATVNACVLSSETTARLIFVCKREQTSVHAAICAAFLFALRDRRMAGPLINLKCATAIDFRPFLDETELDEAGMYVGGKVTSHQIDARSNLWDVARGLKRQLKQETIAEKLYDNIYETYAMISTCPSPTDLLQTFVQTLKNDVVVTNLKRVSIPQQSDDLRLKAMYGPMVMAGMKNERVVGVCTLGDQMFLTLVSPKAAPRSEAEQLHGEAVALLEAALMAL